VLSQYIPLPAYKAPVDASAAYDEVFENLRTPMFFLVFIGVLLVQLFWKGSKYNTDKATVEANQGPLEKSLRGRAPGGGSLTGR